MKISRRDFIKYIVIGGATLAAGTVASKVIDMLAENDNRMAFGTECSNVKHNKMPAKIEKQKEGIVVVGSIDEYGVNVREGKAKDGYLIFNGLGEKFNISDYNTLRTENLCIDVPYKIELAPYGNNSYKIKSMKLLKK